MKTKTKERAFMSYAIVPRDAVLENVPTTLDVRVHVEGATPEQVAALAFRLLDAARQNGWGPR